MKTVPGSARFPLYVIPAEAEIQRFFATRTGAPTCLTLAPSCLRWARTLKKLSSVVALLLFIIVALPLHAAEPADLEEQTRALAAELRCVVCQNLSVADSPSEMAQQMRAIVRQRLQAGDTPQQIKDFFVSKYGEWVLLKPKTSGISLLLWVVPFAALGTGLVFALWLMRRWAKRPAPRDPTHDTDQSPNRLDNDFLRKEFTVPELDDTSLRAELLRERGRLAAELRDLEFDYQAGKHSEIDFAALKSAIEAKAVPVMAKLAMLPAPARGKAATEEQPAPRPAREEQGRRVKFRGWQLAAGGSFLLLFGLALGILLMQSLRPRVSEQDTITGDFMTGTSGAATAKLLQEGKQAFAQQDFAKAIDSFKHVLAQEPNQPEAHAYMGFILMQAGHGDGALMAFEKALEVAPNFPMALWGKGMVLYQDKKDYVEAREVLARLLDIMPQGAERNEVAKVLAEIPGASQSATRSTTSSAVGPSATISGKITLNAKLPVNLDSNAALFIIARTAGGGAGPPLAVKKIANPTFPLAYSLGQENVMMQSTPFAGKIDVTVRLDKDGNAMTRETGNLLGEYAKNPVEVGARNVDIVIDRIAQ
jgi:cytochrome c-type biogenesis protein CcmH